MTRLQLHTSALSLMLVLAVSLPHGQGVGEGRVIGRVRLTTKIPGRPLPSTAYPRRTVGDTRAPSLPEIRNVVVYIKDLAFSGALPTSRTDVLQEHETFIPKTVAITRGSTVDFPNADPYFHNVFSLSRAANFNLGRYQRGQSRGREFTKAGIVKVYCDIHSHMSATILVFDHPYFTIPELDGSFELPPLPPGEHMIVGWHERVGERSMRIRVDANKTTSVDLLVPVPEGDDAP